MRWEAVNTKFGQIRTPKRLPYDMSTDVKRVTGSLKTMLDAVKSEVQACEQDVANAHKETLDTVHMARTMMKTVRDDVSELRQLLGVNSNFPPEKE